MAVTIRDIASKLDVTHATVSRALRDMPDIAVATCERVKKQAIKMGYQPNLLAKGLSRGKTNTIGFVACSVAGEFARKKLERLHSLVDDRGYSFSFFMTKAGSAEEEIAAVNEMLARGMDGLVISTQVTQVGEQSHQYFSRFNERGYPYVLFDSGRDLTDFDGCCVTFDRVEAGRMVVEHLFELGHRRIGFLGPQRGENYRQKERGYAQAMQSHGLETRRIVIPDPSSGYKFGYQHVMKNAEVIRGMTALFCHNDRSALGAIRALKDMGIDVPGQMAIVGFDNDNMGEMITPSLTTIAPPVDQLVRATVDLLFERIESGRRPLSRHIEIKPQLIVRESSGTTVGREA